MFPWNEQTSDRVDGWHQAPPPLPKSDTHTMSTRFSARIVRKGMKMPVSSQPVPVSSQRRVRPHPQAPQRPGIPRCRAAVRLTALRFLGSYR